ncbi:CopG family ribbon-helix-helix protein [uncultured Bradyrhizobium sp.]|uniref:CopG family ribbon-helix-helix protein n=1 Tax=uncultured Bradyrhizobium sp. TaxID=199684 RepID=UPI0035CC20CD
MARTRTALCISLPPEMAEELDTIATEEDRSRSEVVREGLRDYCKARRLADLPDLVPETHCREAG